MSPDTIADLQERLTDATDPAEVATLHLELGVAYRRTAGSLARAHGAHGRARSAYEQSTVHYRRAAETIRTERPVEGDGWEELPVVLRGGLVTALLAHDEPLRREAATEALALPEEYVETYPRWEALYYYVKTYGAAVAEHGGVGDYLEDARRAMAGAGAGSGSVDEPGLWRALTGVLTGDADRVREGLVANVSGYHGAPVRGEGPADGDRTDGGDRSPGVDGNPRDGRGPGGVEGEDEEGVLGRALAMAVLARQYGHRDVLPDSPAVPRALLTRPGGGR